MNLFQRWLALPPDLFDLIITDYQLLLVAQIAISATKSNKTHDFIIEKKKKKFGFDLRTAIQYNSIRYVRNMIDHKGVLGMGLESLGLEFCV